MAFSFRNLDEKTRALMLEEIEADIASGTLFLSENLSPAGREAFPRLIKEAARHGSDATLAAAIHPLLNTHEKPRRLKSGDYSTPPKMRSNAHEMLGEGEFNRFYIRALCRRALDEGLEAVVVYRAKAVENARSESEARIGDSVPAQQLLDDLRGHQGVDTALGLPPGPNSGLCVRLP